MGGTPLHYDAEIEYLESSGTQWIDTGVVCRSYDGIKATFQANGEQKGGNGYFFFGQGYSYNNNNIEVYSSTLKTQISFCLQGYTDVTLDYTNVFNVDVKNKIATYTDEFGQVIGVANRSDVGNYTAAYTMAVFATHRSPIIKRGNIRCFKFQIIQDSTIVIDLIPVRVGQTGYLYDKVSGKLFGNNGTGDFVLGPDREVIMTSESNPEANQLKNLSEFDW